MLNDLDFGAGADTATGDTNYDAWVKVTARLAVLEAAAGPTLSALTLAAAAVQENTAAGVVIGGILGKTAGSAVSLVNDAGGRFAIVGTNLVTGVTATDYEAATSHNITLRETLAGAANTPRDTVLAISVTNVNEQPNLVALAFSTSSFTLGVVASGAIVGATAGSAIAATGLPAGLTVDGTARTWAYSGGGAAGASDVTLTETLGDSANSPKSTVRTVAIAAAVPGATAPVMTLTTTPGTNPPSWDSLYSNMIPDSDLIGMRFRSPAGSGAWIEEVPQLYTSEVYQDYQDYLAYQAYLGGTGPQAPAATVPNFAWPLFEAAAPFPAGQTVEWQEDVRRGSDAPVRGNILSDTMSASAVAYTSGGGAELDAQGANHTYAGCDFAASGIAIVAVFAGAIPTGVKVGGVAATPIASVSPYYAGSLWEVPVTAGSKAVVVTMPAGWSRSAIQWGVFANANATPTQVEAVPGNANGGPPMISGVLTVPTGGQAVSFVLVNGAPAAAAPSVTGGSGNILANSSGTLVSGGEKYMIVSSQRATSGRASFGFTNADVYPILSVVHQKA